MDRPALDRFLARLAVRPSTPAVANPYAGSSAAAERRRHNLARYLDRLVQVPAPIAIIGEAPGYRGCAVTGIPFTSRRVLAEVWPRWPPLASLACELSVDEASPWSEPTASVLWRHLTPLLDAPPLLWNAFPFHPHPPGDASANRRPGRAELAEGAPYLRELIDLFQPRLIMALGRVAQQQLAGLGAGLPCVLALRHPAQGGAAQFAAGLQAARAIIQPPEIGNHTLDEGRMANDERPGRHPAA
jgi:hypothetical protein